eukprot:TRINITY_DN2543_c0_g1_i3.p1 TRINITY_DN2543_c0_g1~~TRINITY_DN2543_c0_g1_i3.p1  ORF type:complete len:451 (+),score=52.12 TRINITY_DN2543_c0_g1_i3:46-1353(+)
MTTLTAARALRPKPTTAIKLLIARFASLENESIFSYGVNQIVHSVIKNVPFQVEITSPDHLLNFHNVPAMDCKLYYHVANDDEDKQVDFVKLSPIEYTTKTNGTGESITLEVKLNVLSSQHEDSYFKIKFWTRGSNLSVTSPPIRVVSKMNQLKKCREALRAGTKRTFNDMMKDTLQRIEEQQREQARTMATILEKMAPDAPKRARVVPSNPFSSDFVSSFASSPIPAFSEDNRTPAAKFESQLLDLIATYHAIPSSDRAATVRNALGAVSTTVTDQLAEVVDCISVEALQRPAVGTNINTGSPYQADCGDGFAFPADYGLPIPFDDMTVFCPEVCTESFPPLPSDPQPLVNIMRPYPSNVMDIASLQGSVLESLLRSHFSSSARTTPHPLSHHHHPHHHPSHRRVLPRLAPKVSGVPGASAHQELAPVTAQAAL